MSDLVSRLLEAIGETEDCARLVQGGRREWHIGELPYEGYLVMDGKGARVVFSKQLGVDHHIARNDPASVLRRCAADREEVELHGIVWRNIGWLVEEDGELVEEAAELPVCGLCVPRHSSFPRREDVPEGPCQTLRLRALAYGISVEEETTGE